MTESAIQLQEVCKQFGRHLVLDRINFELPPGNIVALLGRNGAGKSTSIRIMMGLTQRDEGTVSILGRDPAREPLAVRQSVGYLAEDQTMYGWMTVEEAIRFVASFYPTWDHTYANLLARQFELTLRQRVRELSKGQNIRVGLLMALAHRPKLVILDDPALGLDPIMRKEFNRELIEHLQGQGTSVLYSSHLLYEVESVADAVAILDHGRILKYADTELLHEDVKQFVVDKNDFPTICQTMLVLDQRHQGNEVAIVAENAAVVRELLSLRKVPFREIDLTLDDIFESYVIGRRDAFHSDVLADHSPLSAL